ncbi:MAG: aldehyde dehydrogenase family protein [Verrucomicrobia bacterium]|nr:aldehyde dehydrogenase family protein [Verrucomicrobiota bacterium]
MPRLPITKTPKVFVGGAFIRSESGRVLPVYQKKQLLGNVPRCTRKDLRNAVEAAAKAAPGWAARTAYNRGQILYRLGEMLESRADELAACVAQSDDARLLQEARREVAASVDRLIYYAGWADKFAQVLGNTNPVAGPFFNFTLPEPMGVVGVLAAGGAETPLLGLLSQLAPIIVSGNVVVALASEAAPLPAILLGEILAVSDLPAGVVNLLTGLRAELLPTFATHAGLRALDAADVTADEEKTLDLGAAASVKRLHMRRADNDAAPVDWFATSVQGVEEIGAFVEFKTVWHPVGA